MNMGWSEMAKETIEDLKKQLEICFTTIEQQKQDNIEQRLKLQANVQELNHTLMEFGDLKRRLHNAEHIIERMRGYIARVQEDDIVNEPLVATGNEDEKHLAPKRQHTSFSGPEDPYIDTMAQSEMRHLSELDRRKQRRHWTEYGGKRPRL